MNKLFKRHRKSSLEEYHAPDFGSPEFDAFAGEASLRNGPLKAVQASPESAVMEWADLSPIEFETGLAEAENQRRKNGVLSYDLILAPPKSFSIAALATPELYPLFLRIHQVAVDGVVDELRPLLGVPKNRAADPTWEPARAQIWRFQHAFNLDLGPHLHTHLCLFNRAIEPTGCLDGTVLFDHLWELDRVYHYGLRAGLAMAGVPVFHSPQAPYWAWRLADVPLNLETVWGSTTVPEAPDEPSYLAALSSRKSTPKLHGVSLSRARKKWLKQPKLSDLMMSFGEPSPSLAEVSQPDPILWFQQSGILSRLQLFGEFLRPLMGSPIPLHDRRTQFDRLINSVTKTGEVLSHANRVFCHPDTYQMAQEFLKRALQGRGKGQGGYVILTDASASFPGFSATVRAAAKPDVLKLACLPQSHWQTMGGRLIQADQLKLSGGGQIVAGFGLGLREILAKVSTTKESSSTLLLLAQEDHRGPFWAKLLKKQSSSPARKIAQKSWPLGQGRSLQIRKGRIHPDDHTFRGLFSRPEKDWCVLAPAGMSAEEYRHLQRWLFHRLVKIHPLTLVLNRDQPVVWPSREQYHEAAGATVVACRPNRLLPRGKAWVIQAALDNEWHMACSPSSQRIIPFPRLDEMADHFLLSRRQELLLPLGMSCRLTQSISLSKVRLPEGSLVMPQGYDHTTRSILCADDIILPWGYRFLEPSILSRSLPARGCNRLICEAMDKPTLAAMAKILPAGTPVDILTFTPEVLREDLQMLFPPPRQVFQSESEKTAPVKAKASYFPRDDFWWERIRERELLKTPAPRKNKPVKGSPDLPME